MLYNIMMNLNYFEYLIGKNDYKMYDIFKIMNCYKNIILLYYCT